MEFVGKSNLLGSRFLEIIYFAEKTSLWIRRAGLSQPALCFSFPVYKLEKKYLVDYVAKYLILLDGVLCRRERFVGWKNIENLHITSPWPCLYHAGKATFSMTRWSMFWAPSNFLPRSVLCWQPVDNSLRGMVLHHVCALIPIVPAESMSHATNSVFKGETLHHHTFQKCPIMKNSRTVACLIVSRCAEAFF